MRLSDVLVLAVKALRDRKLRSALTVLGIMIGASILLGLMASTNGLNAGVGSQLGKISANSLYVMPARASFSKGGASQFYLTDSDVRIIKSFPGVGVVAPYYQSSVTITAGGNAIQGSLRAMDPSQIQVFYNGIALYQGGLPSPTDTLVGTVGYDVAFPPSAGVQLASYNGVVTITMAGAKGGMGIFVKGILQPYGTSLFSNVDDTIFVSLAAGQFLLKSPYYNGIMVLAKSLGDVASIQNELQNYYGQNVRIINPGNILNSVQSVTAGMTAFLGGIGAVSLLVAAIGIANTMYVTVMERIKEIGVLKAIGYTSRQIMMMFLSEAGLTGALGGILGTLVGAALAYLMGQDLSFAGGGSFLARPPGGGGGGFAPIFTPQMLAFSLMFPIVMALAAGVYPAWRASKMNAIVALKYE